MANYADLLAAESKKNSEVRPIPPLEKKEQPISQSTDQSIDQSTNQSTDKPTNQKTKSPVTHTKNQSVNRPISQSTSRLTNRPVDNKVVDRPKAFYLYKRLDRKIDEAVRYYQDKHGIRKTDRSLIVNAFLDDDELWTEESLDRLVDRLISQLTSRLTGQ